MKKIIYAVLYGLFLLGLTGMAQAACQYQAISVGQTVSGSLSSTDCIDIEVDGSQYYADYYEFAGSAGQQVYVSLSSSAIDPFLVLFYPDGSYTYASGSGTNARIPVSGYVTLPASGTYIVMASSDVPLQSGAYTLSIAASTTLGGAGSPVIEFYNTNLKHYFMTADSCLVRHLAGCMTLPLPGSRQRC